MSDRHVVLYSDDEILFNTKWIIRVWKNREETDTHSSEKGQSEKAVQLFDSNYMTLYKKMSYICGDGKMINDCQGLSEKGMKKHTEDF